MPASIMEFPKAAHPQAAGLDVGRIAITAATGMAAWLAGLLLIRGIGPLGWLSDGRTVLVYALILLATVPGIAAVPRRLGLGREYRLHCAAIMSAAACLTDAVVVRWTHWYAADAALRADAAASLLWAIGVAVGLGLVMSAPWPRPQAG